MDDLKVAFVLPVAGGSGGANSVVQEAVGIVRIGVAVGVIVDTRNYRSFLINYPDVEQRGVTVLPFDNVSELADHIAAYDIVVATINRSVADIARACERIKAAGAKAPRVAYYVQDYEPLFYQPGSEEWRLAHASYALIPDAVLFAKTKWLQDIVYSNHGIRVSKVLPSMNHDIYYPQASAKKNALSIVAMVRAKTPRRAPHRTIRIMEKLILEFGSNKINLTIFGTNTRELADDGFVLSPGINNRGRLKAHEVPALFRGADLFLDLSDYQAFGRTGLEGMCCGVVPVLPIHGGVSEYAEHGKNAYVVDTRSDEQIMGAITHYAGLSDRARNEMRVEALATGARFSVHSAAMSEYRLFEEIYHA
ncbi:glycosyltransferase family 4 protein [Methylopila sp. M107]|uniref:glycosyltransferase family 4 protein n=1 Tax=Methylopila sp. M107 TaxID=1101190 RepID=UPI0018CA38F3|nr:glycosyltransferase family 4 protein [Methylopila sp. M107]